MEALNIGDYHPEGQYVGAGASSQRGKCIFQFVSHKCELNPKLDGKFSYRNEIQFRDIIGIGSIER